MENRCVVMATRPAPGPVDPSHFRTEVRPVPDLQPGEALVRVAYVDVQPAMRGWLAERPAYTPPIAPGEVMRAQGVGEVVASRNPQLAEGQWVHSMLGAQSLSVVGPDQPTTVLDLEQGPPERFLSALGSSGMTAYFGLFDVGQLKPSDTVVISSAAGAVGSVAGQIAKHHGCRVVGLCGHPDKCRYLVDELGFDGAIDYKEDDVYAEVQALCPNGVDVYFDNVGGPLLDAMMLVLAPRARIVISGMLSQYNAVTTGPGLRFYGMLLVKHARMEGFLAYEYRDRYPETRAQIAAWIEAGAVKPREHILDGLHNFGQAFQMLFDGRSFGKMLLRV